MMNSTEYRNATYANGRDALKRVGKTTQKLYSDWGLVLDSLAMARDEVAEILGNPNDISSAPYKKEIRKVLDREQLGEEFLHKQVRKTCWKIIENREAIEAWHAKLDQHQKQMWNSPDAVMRNWKASLPASLKPARRTREEPDPSGMLADMAELAAKDAKESGFDDSIPFGDPGADELRAEIERLKAEIVELNDVIEHLRTKIAELGGAPAPKKATPAKGSKVKVTYDKKGDGSITGILG